MPFNGFSEEYLDRLETNGNIQADNKAYAKRKYLFIHEVYFRQISVFN